MKYLVPFLFIVTLAITCNKENFEPPVFQCSVKAKADCKDSLKITYSFSFDRNERFLIESQIWVQHETDSTVFCLAAMAAKFTQANTVTELEVRNVVDSVRFDRALNCQDKGKVKIVTDIYEQSLADFRYKKCGIVFYYQK